MNRTTATSAVPAVAAPSRRRRARTIADTVTDPVFGSLTCRVRSSELVIGNPLSFVDAAGVVLPVSVPCPINTHGAWFRDGERYEGTRWHKKEGAALAWGQRRPKKSRKIATSINTYLDLSGTGVPRTLPAAAPGGGAPR